MNTMKILFLSSMISIATGSFVNARNAPVHESQPAAHETQQVAHENQVANATEGASKSRHCSFFNPC